MYDMQKVHSKKQRVTVRVDLGDLIKWILHKSSATSEEVLHFEKKGK